MAVRRWSSVWVRKAVVVLAVLAAANAVLALAEPALPDPVVYPTREVQLNVERLEARAADGCVDLLVAGNSVAAAALSGQRLAERLGLEEGVVGVLPGSIASVDVDWMNRVTLPRAEPGTVVYVASPIMFFPESSAEDFGLEIYRRSIALRGGWAGDLQRWAVDHIPLIRARGTISDAETMVDAARGDVPDEPVETAPGYVFEADGHVASTLVWNGDPERLADIRSTFNAVGDRWRLDLEQRDALRDQVERLERDGTDVVVVIPPVADDLPPQFPDGAAGFERYLEAARTVTEGTDAVTVDLSRAPYPDDLFQDTHHLNEAGSRQLTEHLVAALGDQRFRDCEAEEAPNP